MSSVLDMRTAIIGLFKAGNSGQDISNKSLSVNRMLVWRTLKRYEKTGDIKNRTEQDRPRTARTPKLVKSTREKIRRNPKRYIQNLAKESNVSYRAMSTVLRKNLNCSHSSMSRNTNFLVKLLTNDSKDARFFFPAF